MIRKILDTLMTTLSQDDRNALVKAAGDLGDVVSSNLDVRDRAKQAVAVLAGSGISVSALKGVLGDTKEKSGEIASATGAFVRNNPKQVGFSVGTAAVAAVGAYVLYRMYEAKADAEIAEQPAALIEDHSE